MRIPPVLAVDKSVYVPVGDVHAAKESDVPIGDHNLAVVAKANAVGKQHEVEAEEWRDLHTVFTELVDKISPRPVTSAAVKDYTNLNAFARLFYQCIFYLAAGGVLFEYIILQVVELLRLADRFKKGRKLLLPIK